MDEGAMRARDEAMYRQGYEQGTREGQAWLDAQDRRRNRGLFIILLLFGVIIGVGLLTKLGYF